MNPLDIIDQRFDKVCFTLSEEDILKINKEESGAGIHNVVSNINRHCFGVRIFERKDGKFDVEMFYITNHEKLRGDILCLPLKDPDHYDLMLYFCFSLTDWYPDLDAFNCFNIFQSKLRSGLEKYGFFTATSLELEEFRGQDAIMITTAPKGIIKIDLIDRTRYYRDFFNNNFDIEVIPNQDYVYLMVNNESGLIKIGTSKKPRFREKTLHSSEPQVYLIALWSCPKTVEKDLHKKYIEKKIRGEWFRLSLRDLREIELLMNQY